MYRILFLNLADSGGLGDKSCKALQKKYQENNVTLIQLTEIAQEWKVLESDIDEKKINNIKYQ